MSSDFDLFCGLCGVPSPVNKGTGDRSRNPRYPLVNPWYTLVNPDYPSLTPNIQTPDIPSLTPRIKDLLMWSGVSYSGVYQNKKNSRLNKISYSALLMAYDIRITWLVWLYKIYINIYKYKYMFINTLNILFIFYTLTRH